MIIRIGQWVDPDSGETLNQSPITANDRDRSGLHGWRSRLSELVKGRRRQGSLPLVEDHPYRTCECIINEALIDRLDELARNIYDQAVAQAWSLDWAALATLRRQAADARAAKNVWVSLRKAGEIISVLGQAARFFRKNAGPAAPEH
jgi:hypothetical protein